MPNRQINPELINKLASRAIGKLDVINKSEIERVCWMIVHEYEHGLMPFEYDIKEIDENLYLLVMETVNKELKV